MKLTVDWLETVIKPRLQQRLRPAHAFVCPCVKSAHISTIAHLRRGTTSTVYDQIWQVFLRCFCCCCKRWRYQWKTWWKMDLIENLMEIDLDTLCSHFIRFDLYKIWTIQIILFLSLNSSVFFFVVWICVLFPLFRHFSKQNSTNEKYSKQHRQPGDSFLFSMKIFRWQKNVMQKKQNWNGHSDICSRSVEWIA